MRRLFLVVFALIMLSTTPTLGSIPVQIPQFPALVATGTQEPTRVYGDNFASEIYSLCSTESYRYFVQELSEIGSRFTGNTENNIAARTWIGEQLTSISRGRVEVEIVGSFNNVVGYLPGYLPGEHPVFVVSAHYDTAEGSPGANDDGSGVALVLELARVMSQYEWPLDIYFVAFNAALPPIELGPTFQGSEELAQIWEDDNLEILALFNVDSILFPNRWAPLNERILLGYADDTPYHTSQYWAELAKMVGSVYGSDAIRPMPSSTFPLWFQSDHIKFYQEGYESVVCAYESGYFYDDVTGTSNDVYTYDAFNYYLGRVTAGIIGCSMAFSMSRAYGEKTHVYPEGMLSSGSPKTFHIAITTPTTIDVFSRWWGGGAEFRLYSPSDVLIDSVLYNNASAWESRQLLSTPVTSIGLYKVVIGNLAMNSLGYEMEIAYDTDVDVNGILDRNEYWLDTALFQIDDDGDSLSNALEIILGTDINSADSDTDYIPDSWEYDQGFDPLDPSDASEDADYDGVSNLNEYLLGLDPWSADSDLDKLPDLWEIENGLNPLSDDADLDLDGDGKTNWEEYKEGTNPQLIEQGSLNPLYITVSLVALVIVLVGLYEYKKYSSLI